MFKLGVQWRSVPFSLCDVIEPLGCHFRTTRLFKVGRKNEFS